MKQEIEQIFGFLKKFSHKILKNELNQKLKVAEASDNNRNKS